MNKKYVYLNLVDELLKHEDYKDVNGDLHKQNIISRIKQLDEKTMNIILSFPELKNKFTKKLNDTILLDQQSLLSFFQSREFINNSFTEYTNKVGLTNGLNFLDNNSEVILDFPYKDCVLLGNQSKEENEGIRQKYFHEVINFQEIDRLFTKKVLCNFIKHTQKGIMPVNDFKDTDNLIIKGNNLIVLHTIKEKFAGKIKLIYIDPPYNTESLKFTYNDKFDQSTWLTFMKNRLDIAKDLLKEDGIIVLSIDNKQLCHLKLLLDNIFSNGFVTIINVELSTTQGMKVNSAQKGNIVKNTEYLLIYSKNGNKTIMNQPLYTSREWDVHYSQVLMKDNSVKTLNNFIKEHDEISQIFKLHGKSFKDSICELYLSNSKVKDFLHENSEKIFRTAQIELNDIQNLNLNDNEVQVIIKENKTYYIKKNSNEKIDQLLFLSDSIGETDDFIPNKSLRKIRGDWWSDYYKDMMNLDKEGSVKLDNGKKPERLLKDIIKSFTKNNDIILDYHLGSGTTCAVAHKMGRQYIGIEQLDYGNNDSIKRLDNVINGDSTGISKFVDWQGGGEFISMNLFSLVDEILNKIKQAQSQSEINDIVTLLLSEKYFYYLGINENKTPYEEIFVSDEFKQLSIDVQKQILHASIDKNNLYVDFNDLHDTTVNLSKEEKELNEKFYKDNK